MYGTGSYSLSLVSFLKLVLRQPSVSLVRPTGKLPNSLRANPLLILTDRLVSPQPWLYVTVDSHMTKIKLRNIVTVTLTKSIKP